MDVVSRGEAIDAGTEVVVVEVSGNRVIVARRVLKRPILLNRARTPRPLISTNDT